MTNRREFMRFGVACLGAALMPNLLQGAEEKSGILKEVFTLNDGVKIPKLGLGVWQIEDSIVENVIQEALKVGYRHIDTAQAYGNERGVGAAVRKSGLKREELFITSKVRAEYKDKKSAADSIDATLKTMGLDFVDLMLIHSPRPWASFHKGNYFQENMEVWEALEEAQKAGKVRSIGVSNFEQKDLQNILKNGKVKPSMNQILAHTGNTPFELMDFCKKQGILVEVYSPITHGELLRDSRIITMAQKYNVSPAQLCRYTLELGLISLLKRKTPAYIAQNAELGFTLSKSDLDLLKKMKFWDYDEHSSIPVFGGK